MIRDFVHKPNLDYVFSKINLNAPTITPQPISHIKIDTKTTPSVRPTSYNVSHHKSAPSGSFIGKGYIPHTKFTAPSLNHSVSQFFSKIKVPMAYELHRPDNFYQYGGFKTDYDRMADNWTAIETQNAIARDFTSNTNLELLTDPNISKFDKKVLNTYIKLTPGRDEFLKAFRDRLEDEERARKTEFEKSEKGSIQTGAAGRDYKDLNKRSRVVAQIKQIKKRMKPVPPPAVKPIVGGGGAGESKVINIDLDVDTLNEPTTFVKPVIGDKGKVVKIVLDDVETLSGTTTAAADAKADAKEDKQTKQAKTTTTDKPYFDFRYKLKNLSDRLFPSYSMITKDMLDLWKKTIDKEATTLTKAQKKRLLDFEINRYEKEIFKKDDAEFAGKNPMLAAKKGNGGKKKKI